MLWHAGSDQMFLVTPARRSASAKQGKPPALGLIAIAPCPLLRNTRATEVDVIDPLPGSLAPRLHLLQSLDRNVLDAVRTRQFPQQ